MHYNFDEIVPREGTGSFKYDLRGEYFGNPDLVPLWVADMDFRTPDFIMKAIRARAEHEILGYTVRENGFFESIAGWYERRYDWKINKEWILTTPGVVPALHMAIRALTEPGDKIIIQPPVYHPFFSLIRENDRVLVSNQLRLEGDEYRMDLDALERQAAEGARLILLSHPHNPVGRVWNRDELAAVGEICVKNDITILSDEIHCDLVYPPHRHHPLATLGRDLLQRTLTFAAPSKTFNLAGLSTSFIIAADPGLRKSVGKELETSHLRMGNLFGTIALEAAYRNGDDWLDQLLAYLQGNLDFLEQFIREQIPAIRVIRPQATYLVWLDVSRLGMDDKETKDFLVNKAGLGFNEGQTFGPGGEGFQRINIGCPRSILAGALEKLRDAVGPVL